MNLLDAAAAGDPTAAGLLPLVYDELGQFAAARVGEESPVWTLRSAARVELL